MKLWKGNKRSQEYDMPHEEIARRFVDSPFYGYLTSWRLERCLRAFLCDHENGLDSVYEEVEFDVFFERVRAYIEEVGWPGEAWTQAQIKDRRPRGHRLDEGRVGA